MRTQTFTTHKIFLLVAFIAAAIMTSLFLFHLKHKPSALVASTNERTIFPVARNIKAFEFLSDEKKFTQKDLLGHWTLLFFGFTHCSNVCPATLDMLKTAYPSLQQAIPNIQVVLISLDPDRDDAKALSGYTHAYHPDFIGVTGDLKELRKLQSQLGIFSARESQSQDNYQIEHTASIILINPKGQWAGLFKFGISATDFSRVAIESVKALSAG